MKYYNFLAYFSLDYENCPITKFCLYIFTYTVSIHYTKATWPLKTRDVRNELLIVLYLDIHVGHDKNQYIPILVYARSTQRCINVHFRLNVSYKICHINTRSH